MPGNLEGDHWVRVAIPAIHDARALWPRTKDRMTVRRHALKLRYWPQRNAESENGLLFDLDWSWVKAMRSLRIGELRIDE